MDEQVYRKLSDIPGGPVDVIIIFLPPGDLSKYIQEIISARPKCVWMQPGITHASAEARFKAAGITLMVGRCIMADRKAAKS